MAQVRAITPDEQNAYQQHGVVLLKGALDLATVNTIRRAIGATLATARQSPAAYDLSQLAAAASQEDWAMLDVASSGQHAVAELARRFQASGKRLLRDETHADSVGQFYIDTGSAARIGELKRLITQGTLPGIAAALLGGDEVRLVDDQVFVKGPNTPERTAFHQDATYLPVEGEQCCVLWIPVDETDLSTGTMQYVRGSHRDGRLYQPNMFISQATLPGGVGEELPDIEATPDDYDIVHFETEPGDVLVHHYRTIHGTGGNLSEMIPRRALSVRYGGDDLRYVDRPGAPVRPHHQDQQTPNAPLQGNDYPVVWHRAAA